MQKALAVVVACARGPVAEILIGGMELARLLERIPDQTSGGHLSSTTGCLDLLVGGQGPDQVTARR